jgi:leucyl aminopeptidase
MQLSSTSRSVTLDTDAYPLVTAEILAVPMFEGDTFEDVPGLDAASGGLISRAVASGEINGRPFETFLTPLTGWKAERVLLVGAGKRDAFTSERLRRCATTAAATVRQRKGRTLAWAPRGDVDLLPAVQASVEGLGLAAFSSDRYKSRDRQAEPLAGLTVIVPGAGNPGAIEAAIHRGAVLAESTNIARELCNEPPNLFTPAIFADRAVAIAKDAGLEVEILDEHRIAELGMGLLLGVGQGSAAPPRVIVLRHSPADAPDGPVLGLVGKGITFDTGGISIKPAENMDRMKDDMAGGAAVLCAMRAISLLNAPMKVVGVIPTAENMPGGRAMRPADVLTSASGLTVEVVNTDAEGRLILGDGLWYARQLGATHLVDVATLTGACVVALGKVASAIFGQPQGWVDTVRRTGERAGDRLWPMPLYDEYADQLKSEIADMINSGGRYAGACTAATFLKEFTGGLPWVHLDIAGTAWAEEARPWQPKGATAPAVRTLAELAFTGGEWTL